MNKPQAPRHLRVEYRVDPMGIDVVRPRLSWEVNDPQRGAVQTAYRVLVASAPGKLVPGKADLWDSGRVASDASIGIVYDGKPLASGQTCHWRVQTWNGARPPSPWSRAAVWELGLLGRSEWQGQWIGAALLGGKNDASPCPYLRRSFTVASNVRRARLYATALGLYECEINGRRVGRDVFTPGWTDYQKRVQYQAYDVTALLKPGANALGALLGDGWYCGHIEWRDRQFYGDRPRMLAQLAIDYADGTRQIVATDRHWLWTASPTLSADIIMGESYDARLEIPGWSMPGTDDARWLPVEIFADPGIALVANGGPTVKPIREIEPVSVLKANRQSWTKSQWIFDLGQNMVGHVRIKVRGEAGACLSIRHAEMLNEHGDLYTAGLRSARATDTYTLKGGGEETWEPRFTFHGFRYVELRGWIEEPDTSAVTGVVVHSDMDQTGSFRCSEPLLNQLQHNIEWSQRGNFLDIPTDCPQRDERLGWTGDAQVFVRTASFNMDVDGFFTKWQQDLADAQRANGNMPPVAPTTSLGNDPNMDGGPAWADAMVICPWTIYRCYGDRDLLARHYESIQRFVDSLERRSLRHIRVHPDVDKWGGFGDWLSINAETPKDLIGTAFYAYGAGLMSEIAAAVGKTDDAVRYAKLRERICRAFVKRFVTAEGLIVGKTQTAYVLALYFDLLPERLRAAAAEDLVRDIEARGMHLSTGFVGAPYLLHALTRAGRTDVAYKLLLQQSFPSWLYPVLQGATTIWERWDGWTKEKGFQDPGMNSFNHYAYGSVGAWMYQAMAGIDLDPTVPAYKHIVIRPRLPAADGKHAPAVTHAAASLRSVYGMIESGWKIEGDTLRLTVSVPANTTASVYVPAKDAGSIRESGKPARRAPGVIYQGMEGDAARFEVGAGRYLFTTAMR